MAECFWNQLKLSISALAELFDNKTEDDACFLLHVVLRNITTGYFQNSKFDGFSLELIIIIFLR